MNLSVRLLAISTMLAFAPAAYAGGLDDPVEDEEVIIVEQGSSGSAPLSLALGSLGGGGALVAGLVLAAALAAAASGSSGSH